MDTRTFNVPALRDSCSICGMPMFIEIVFKSLQIYVIVMSCIEHDWIKWTYFSRVELHSIVDYGKKQKEEEAR
jgi:hypothetical protein